MFCCLAGNHQPEACGTSFCEALIEKVRRDNATCLRSPAILIEASQVAQQEPSVTREERTERDKATWRGRRQGTGECDIGRERWEGKNNAEVRMTRKGQERRAAAE